MPIGSEDSIYGAGRGSIQQPLLPYRNYLSDLYVYALSSTFNSHRIWDPSYSDSRDPDLWEKVRRDPVVASACEIRMHSVAARHWRIMPGGESQADEDAAAVIEEMLEGVERFAQSRFEFAGAVITARAFGYIEGERQYDALGGKFANWWKPTRIRDIDRRRFYFQPVWTDEPDGRRTLRTRLMLWNVEASEWRPMKHMRCLVRHVYNDEEARLGYGRGLMEAIYFYTYAKAIVIKEGLKGLERWAQGGMAVGIDKDSPGSVNKTNEDIKDAWKDAWRAWKSEYIFVHGKEDVLTPIQFSGTGHEMVKDWRQYLDDAITRLILGSVLPSGGGGDKGSLARAETEADTTEGLIQYDRLMLDETMTRDLIGCIWHYNRIQLNESGLGAARMPKFSSVQEAKDDPIESARVIATLHQAGIDLRQDEVYERTGFTPPTDKDKVIKGAEQGPEGGFDFSQFLPSRGTEDAVGAVK